MWKERPEYFSERKYRKYNQILDELEGNGKATARQVSLRVPSMTTFEARDYLSTLCRLGLVENEKSWVTRPWGKYVCEYWRI